MDFLTLLQILDTTIRLATPLLFACLAGLFSERAGIFDGIQLFNRMLGHSEFEIPFRSIQPMHNFGRDFVSHFMPLFPL